jgi:hypothetical protein
MDCRFENGHRNSYNFIQGAKTGGAVPSVVFDGKSKISRFLGVKTVSEANGLLSITRFYKNGKAKPEHWTESSARHKAQKIAVYLALNPLRDSLSLPCTVRMTRYSPGELDPDDNLRMALKWIKDAISEVLTQDFVPGRADSDRRIIWEYDQVKCNVYDVKVEIWTNTISKN